MGRTLVREVTDEEVKEFLRTNTKGDECLSCGDTDWTLDGGSHGLFRTHVWGRSIEGESLTEGIGKGVPQMTMTCFHCGFVRTHDLYVIMAWLAAREEVGE